MGQTITEKILSRVAGHLVRQGEIIWAEPDLVTCPEIAVARHLQEVTKLGVDKIWNTDKFFLVVDHRVMIETETEADLNQQMRAAVQKFHIKHFFDVGRHGIGHQLPVELGYVLPGMLVIGGDTHAPTLGGVGALAIAINAELPTVLSTGKIWLKVPQSIQIRLYGCPKLGITSRDVGQFILTQIGAQNGDYKVLEFSGEGLRFLSVDQRMTICNVATEIGVKSALFETDEIILGYLKDRTQEKCLTFTADIDAQYAMKFEIDMSKIEPQISVPPNPAVSVPIWKAEGKKIDWAFIGSCASGRMEDLRIAAAVLKGKTVHPSVKMVIIPSSQEIYLEAIREGLIEIFIQANALVVPPSCGPCYGSVIHLAAGEVCIGTGTRNEPGRMGSELSETYLCGPAAVAASAVYGKIINPVKFFEEVKSDGNAL